MSAGPFETIQFFHRKFDRGTSEAFLLRASNKRSYAVKFREKAQNGVVGIAREYLAGQLAATMAAPVPGSIVLELTQDYVDTEPRLKFNDDSRPMPQFTSGVSFVPPVTEPSDTAARLSICPQVDLAGVLVFNTWVSINDRGWDNYSFHWDSSEVRFGSIDYADSMNVRPGDSPVVGDVAEVQAIVKTAWNSVELCLDRLEQVTDAQIDEAISGMPDEWMTAEARTGLASYLKGARGLTRATLEALPRDP